MEELLFQVVAYTIPALVVGAIALYFFKLQYKNEEQRRRYQLLKENQKQSLPLRIQAYERLALFLDRISPQKLLTRVTPQGTDKKQYELLLLQQIDTEFDHNTTQQLYVSEESWQLVKAAKMATHQIIRKASLNEEIKTADEMRLHILTEFIEKQTPSASAISHLVAEMRQFLY